LSYVNRFLYLGDVTIESEVGKLVDRGRSLGVAVHMVHSSSGATNARAAIPESDPHARSVRPSIVVVIVGNPRGVLSSHHEKLLLVDADCAAGHATAFVGGFDIARGRYDQPLHQIPVPYFELNPPPKIQARFTGPAVQPVLRRIRFLWHDVQVQLTGGTILDHLYLHFAQRWIFAFSGSTQDTCAHTLPPARLLCKDVKPDKIDMESVVQLSRCWRGVLDVQKMFEMHRQAIRRATKFLFIEHQYPFHNWGLAQEMCEALRSNPLLKVVIVTAIKTDLPTGLVGDLVDWSQDHITQHLLHIEREAPDRVVVVGLCQQDEYRKLIKPIYVHSKLIVIDDNLLVTGSANMDDMSFFYSSELTLLITDPKLSRETRLRLSSEHLGMTAPESFDEMFEAFREMATANVAALKKHAPLKGRLVLMAPKDKLGIVLSRVYYPNKISKALYKIGLNTEDWVDYVWSKIPTKIRSRL
jgi:phospholipase D1/2